MSRISDIANSDAIAEGLENTGYCFDRSTRNILTVDFSSCL